MSVPRTFVMGALGGLLVSAVAAQVWTETGDAASFPDAEAQLTRGEGALVRIDGEFGFNDRRDAYCVKIMDPAAFLATTDPVTHPDANASFDSRLFLFRLDGSPVLANDDTPPGGEPFLSTLSAAATDGSGYELSWAGAYVLVVSGPEDPRDALDVDLFLLSPPETVAAANPAAGCFDRWQSAAVSSGSYSVALTGTDFCQFELDTIVANDGQNRLCLGDDSGGFWLCEDVEAAADFSRAAAAGFLDDDPHLDIVFANYGMPNRVCLGAASGRFGECADVSGDSNVSRDVALGLLDDDEYADAVFANTGVNRVCLGDGAGGFSSCADVDSADEFTRAVALGFVDADHNLDAVFANNGEPNEVCLGDGLGGLACTDVDDGLLNTGGVALGFVDADRDIDVMFSGSGANRVCFGDGSGGFSDCADVGGDINETWGLALGLVNGDRHLDAVFANYTSRDRVCLGDGMGGFLCADADSEELVSREVALGLFDGDDHLDALFVGSGADRICLGDGLGGFSCSDIAGDIEESYGGELGDVGSPMIFADGFESGNTEAWSRTVQ